MKTLDVYGLYGESWQNEIAPDAFSHPAKFSRSLIRWIYQHCIEEGYIKPGDRIVDPFGGVALGGLDAMRNGLHWYGCELEQKFVDLGQGYDCPGFTKKDWQRYHGRAGRINYRTSDPRQKFVEEGITLKQLADHVSGKTVMIHGGNAHHWCSDCQKALDTVPEDRVIPAQTAHRYRGNIDLWNERYAQWFREWGSATLVQGDSRRLGELVAGAQACVGSPPFIDGGMGDSRPFGGIKQPKAHWNETTKTGGLTDYGSTPGQLGSMPEGNHADAVVSSPPFGEAQSGGGIVDTGHHTEIRKGKPKQYGHRVYTPDNQGTTEGNLATLKADTEGYAAAIGSPPFANCEGTKDKEFLRRHYEGIGRNPDGPGAQSGLGGHMVSPDNLGNLPEGNHVDAIVTSPPYIDSVNANDAANDSEARRQRKKDSGLPDTAYHRGGPNSVQNRPQVYGSEDGQLGAMKEGNLDATISSPPYADAVSGGEGPGARHDTKYHKGENSFKKSSDAEYGSTPGNLGNMAACVSSPPYEGSLHLNEDREKELERLEKRGLTSAIKKASRNGEFVGDANKGYGDSNGNIGNDQGETFWTAAQTIVEQVYMVLKPGGYAIFVTGDFVRNGKRVYFGRQWLQLCEACGFEAIEWIVAWKSEYRGTQLGLFGEHEEKRVDRVSFFRRLANERNPDNAILNEDVIILRKPL